MNPIDKFLSGLPLGTLIAIAAIVGAIIALINHSIDFEQFLVGIGAGTGGAGLLGVARAQSGKGIKRR